MNPLWGIVEADVIDVQILPENSANKAKWLEEELDSHTYFPDKMIREAASYLKDQTTFTTIKIEDLISRCCDRKNFSQEMEILVESDSFSLEHIFSGRKSVHIMLDNEIARPGCSISSLRNEDQIRLIRSLSQLRECSEIMDESIKFFFNYAEVCARISKTISNLKPGFVMQSFIDTYECISHVDVEYQKISFQQSTLRDAMNLISTLIRKTRIEIEYSIHKHSIRNSCLFTHIVFLGIYASVLRQIVNDATLQYIKPCLLKERKHNIADCFNQFLLLVNEINQIMDLDIEKFIQDTKKQLCLRKLKYDPVGHSTFVSQIQEYEQLKSNFFRNKKIITEHRYNSYPLEFQAEREKESDIIHVLLYCPIIEENMRCSRDYESCVTVKGVKRSDFTLLHEHLALNLSFGFKRMLTLEERFVETTIKILLGSLKEQNCQSASVAYFIRNNGLSLASQYTQKEIIKTTKGNELKLREKIKIFSPERCDQSLSTICDYEETYHLLL